MPLSKECSICEKPLGNKKKPEATTTCGHRFHHKCVEGYMNSERPRKCPECNKKIVLKNSDEESSSSEEVEEQSYLSDKKKKQASSSSSSSSSSEEEEEQKYSPEKSNPKKVCIHLLEV